MTYAPIVSAPIDVVATTTLTLTTRGEGFINFTQDVREFLEETGGVSGTINLFIRHTSASLTIQENADPDVLTDLTTALRRMAPDNAGWIHATEGPDDMPAHIKTMLTSSSLQIPVVDSAMALGTWQGIYLIEHRARPHRREIMMQFIGTRNRS